MRNDKLAAPVELQIPAGIRCLFDDPPLLPSEDPQAYWNLLGTLADEFKPSGVFQWLCVRDMALLCWQKRRLEASKRHIIELARNRKADSLERAARAEYRALMPDFNPAKKEASIREIALAVLSIPNLPQKEKDRVMDIAQECYEQWRLEAQTIESATVNPITKRPFRPELDTEADFAQAFVERIDILEQIDRMINTVDRRIETTLRDFELHQEIQARRPAGGSAKLIEVENSNAPVVPK